MTSLAPAAPVAEAWPAARRGDGPLIRGLTGARNWLDDRGRKAWIVAMVVAFVAAWPVGLALLGYMIWSNRMFSRRSAGGCAARRTAATLASTGNSAFDAYREETLKRLEDEHRAFEDYLRKLREARDKAEFDRFMDERRTASAE